MPDPGEFEAVTFTEDEFAEYFGAPMAEPSSKRRISTRARIVGVIAATAMLAGSVTVLINAINNFASYSEPVEIRDRALERIAESQWGWLATDVVIAPIPEPDIGGRVTNNPPDGIISIDRRNWSGDRLDELVEHELGHLLDFAIWGRAPSGERRNGIDSEAWAECAAVDAGARDVDRTNADERYHCYADEYETYRSAVAALTEVCRSWGEPECRSVDTIPS